MLECPKLLWEKVCIIKATVGFSPLAYNKDKFDIENIVCLGYFAVNHLFLS